MCTKFNSTTDCKTNDLVILVHKITSTSYRCKSDFALSFLIMELLPLLSKIARNKEKQKEKPYIVLVFIGKRT